jgi:hypothetical protein
MAVNLDKPDRWKAMTGIDNGFEQVRLKLQAELDARKTQAERNRLGQFATPTALAIKAISSLVSLLELSLDSNQISYLEPLGSLVSLHE